MRGGRMTPCGLRLPGQAAKLRTFSVRVEPFCFASSGQPGGGSSVAELALGALFLPLRTLAEQAAPAQVVPALVLVGLQAFELRRIEVGVDGQRGDPGDPGSRELPELLALLQLDDDAVEDVPGLVPEQGLRSPDV